MNMYSVEGEREDELFDAIVKTVERDTKKYIFTMRILEEHQDGLDTLIVFEDRSILRAFVSVLTVDGNIACRIKGNYL